MESPTDREREKHDRDGDQHFGVAVTLPPGFSLKNPWITHLFAVLVGGGGFTVANRHSDPDVQALRAEIHEEFTVRKVRGDSTHAALNARIDSTDRALCKDERLAFNFPHRRTP